MTTDTDKQRALPGNGSFQNTLIVFNELIEDIVLRAALGLDITPDERKKIMEKVERVRQALSGNDWQPIQSAPKDGTRILVTQESSETYLGDEGPFHHVAWWQTDNFNVTEFMDRDGRRISPTHWMPLPPVLTTQKGKR